MKIVLLTRDIRVVGGVERVISVLMNRLIEKYNYEVEIISLYKENKNLHTPQFTFNKKIKFRYLDMEIPRPMTRKERIIEARKLKNIVRGLLKDTDADIVMTFHRLISIATLKNKRNIKSKIIITEHGDYFYAIGRWGIMIRRLMYKKADKLVVLTKNNKDIYNKFTDNVIQIPNPIPFEINIMETKENKKIISAGRLEEEKGFDDLIDIFSKIASDNLEWNLDIYGEGSLKSKLENKIVELGLENRIKIKPFEHNIQKVLQKSDIYVLTSKSEAFPMVLLEAMECGLPCISFDLPGPSEIISNEEDGFIIKSRDFDDFANKIQLLMENSNLRKEYSKRAKENIRRYSLDNIVDKWDKLFRELKII